MFAGSILARDSSFDGTGAVTWPLKPFSSDAPARPGKAPNSFSRLRAFLMELRQHECLRNYDGENECSAATNIRKIIR
jgi:hypothetical protein